MMNDELRKLLEQGEISKFDIKAMLKKGELTVDDLIDLLRRYAKFMQNIKDIIF